MASAIVVVSSSLQCPVEMSYLQRRLDEVSDIKVYPTGRTAEDRQAEQIYEAAVASISGRSASDMEGVQQGVPGVFIVHSDGTVATDAGYSK